ncbi:hypothetical protein RYX36_017280, partial [Vicia faba]
MAFHSYQSYLLGFSCIALVLVSGLVTSLETPATVLDETCAPGWPLSFCCSAVCSPNCDQDCKRKGYKSGGHCETF